MDLIRGQRVKLEALTSSRTLSVSISYQSDVAIDVACLGVGADGRVVGDDHVVFYNQPSSPGGSVVISSDATGHHFAVALDRLDAGVSRLVFTATIDGSGTFGTAGSGQVLLSDPSGRVAAFAIEPAHYTSETSVILFEVYYKDVWRTSAVGQGFDGGLGALMRHFGVEVDEAPTVVPAPVVAAPVVPAPVVPAPAAVAPTYLASKSAAPARTAAPVVPAPQLQLDAPALAAMFSDGMSTGLHGEMGEAVLTLPETGHDLDPVQIHERWAKDAEQLQQDDARMDQVISQMKSLVSELDRFLEGCFPNKWGRTVAAQAYVGHADGPLTTSWSIGSLGGHAQVTEALGRADQWSTSARALANAVRNKNFGKSKAMDACLDATRSVLDTIAAVERQKEAISARRRQRAAEALDHLRRALPEHEARMALLTSSGKAWNEAQWDQWVPPTGVRSIHTGWSRIAIDDILRDAGRPDDPVRVLSRTPHVTDFRWWGSMSWRPRQDDAVAVCNAAARSLALRLLAATPPGKSRFTFIDPLGMGSNVAGFLELADYDPLLIDSKAWCQKSEISSKLQELSSHVELIIQKYLKGRYDSIDDYNREAGEVAEPYRFVFIFDFPSQFDEASAHQLMRLLENGSKCGVFVFIVQNPGAQAPYGVDVDAIVEMTNWRRFPQTSGARLSQKYTFELESPPEMRFERDAASPNIFTRIVQTSGERGRGSNDVNVEAERVNQQMAAALKAGVRGDLPSVTRPVYYSDPTSWWTGDASERVTAAVGRAGASDVATLTFDTSILSGALLVGRPGSGKTTLMHAMIASLTTTYAPDELELYLLDFKEGVEFKSYGELGLPHARCVAVESEREFGVAVLETVVAELEDRAQRFRSMGGESVNIVGFRRQTGEKLPRVLVVIDEFHELLATSDRVGVRAGELLEKIIRQGRAFGIHVLLGSQSLAAMDAVGSHVFRLLPIRILLPSSPSDSTMVLGDNNDGGQYLTRRGEGIINPSGGNPEANVRFQGTFLRDEQRALLLASLRALAVERGFDRRPVVFEGQAAVAFPSDPGAYAATVAPPGPTKLRLSVGTPLNLNGSLLLDLSREAGNNVVAVTRDSTGRTDGTLVSLLASVTAGVAQQSGSVRMLDFMPADDGSEGIIAPFLTTGLVTSTRPRQMGGVIDELADLVESRINDNDTRSAPQVLFLNGVHRARDLDGEASPYDDDAAAVATRKLARIAKDGPEVGVHIVATCDSAASFERRFSRAAQREFSWRVGGQMSPSDSQALFDQESASTLKPSQLLVHNVDSGLLARVRGHDRPADDWLSAFSRMI